MRPLSLARPRLLRTMRCGLAALLARCDRALHGGDEIAVHAHELLARVGPDAVIWLARGAHERALPVHVQRGTAALAVGAARHGYATEKVSGLGLRRYAELTDK